MECPKCLIKYRADKAKTPRILSMCGHSFCESCLINLYEKESQKITCYLCQVDTNTDDVKNLIKNLALIDSKKLQIFSDIKKKEEENLRQIGNHFPYYDNYFRSSTPNLSDSKAFNQRKHKNKSISQCLNFSGLNIKNNSYTCNKHSKPLEAFCETDKILLCVSCILENDHKKHDLSSISKAAKQQKDFIENSICKIEEKEKKINYEINYLEDYLKNSKYDFDEKIKNVEDFFKKIFLFFKFREEYIKNKIINIFDNETEKVLFYRKLLEDKNKTIEQIKQEKNVFSKMSDLEILTVVKERNKLFDDIFTNESFISEEENKIKLKKINFYDIDSHKDLEINYLVKILKNLNNKDFSNKSFIEKFELNKDKIKKYPFEFEELDNFESKEFNYSKFSNENLDKICYDIKNILKDSKNSNTYNVQNNINNNIILNSKNLNSILSLAHSGKLANSGNIPNNMINNPKGKNNNNFKVSNISSTAELEKRNICFLNKEEIINYENPPIKKISEIQKEREKLLKKQIQSKKIYFAPQMKTKLSKNLNFIK